MMSHREFGDYMEQVFRHHNRVVDLLIEAAGMGDTMTLHGDETLSKAEGEMMRTCLPLNEVASAMAEGRNPTLSLKRELLEAVPACEAATRNVENRLPKSP